jgi:hypothetical protein
MSLRVAGCIVLSLTANDHFDLLRGAWAMRSPGERRASLVLNLGPPASVAAYHDRAAMLAGMW